MTPTMQNASSTARQVVCWVIATALAGTLLGSCGSDTRWHSTDITGSLPPLVFTMIRANDGKTVTAEDFNGKIVLLYFGYTFCPDVCPLTLANVTRALEGLGQRTDDVRLLFVTVDPERDTLPILKDYTAAFGPEFVGLRGSEDEIAALAKRYRVYYSVTPPVDDKPYIVDHSSAIYVFDQTGRARLLVSGMSTANADINGLTSDLGKLLDQKNPPTLVQRLLQFF